MASSELPWIFQILSRLPRTHTCRKRDSRFFFSMQLVWRLSSRVANLFTFSYFRQSDDELLIRSVVALVHKPVGRQCLNREKPPTFTKTFPKNDDNSQDTGLRRDSLSQQLAISAPLDTEAWNCHPAADDVSKIFPRVRTTRARVREGRTL